MLSACKALRIGATFTAILAAPPAIALTAVPQSGQAAVLFNPGLQNHEILTNLSRSGAHLVRFGGAPGVVVVDLPEDGPAALRRSGAWLVLDPLILGGCSRAASPVMEEETP